MSADSEPTHVLRVSPESDGHRLDRVVAEAIPSWSRSRLQRAIKDGRAKVDGAVVRRPSEAVSAGQTVELSLEGDDRTTSTDVSGREITELDVLHEDEHVVVVNKPAGLVTHPNPRQLAGTVSDLAVARFGPLPEVQGEDRPGIVHRLDRLTSGVIVLGRTDEALRSLKAQFQARTVEKEYAAVVHGEPRFETEWIEAAIAPSPKHHDRMRVVTGKVAAELLETGEARTAETLIERRESFGFASFVAAKPKTGRTHQIRVHLLHAGLPIVGDRVYKRGGAHGRPIPKDAPKMERPALHARRLAFDHPASGERVAFEAEPPDDMRALLEWLRDQSGATPV